MPQTQYNNSYTNLERSLEVSVHEVNVSNHAANKKLS